VRLDGSDVDEVEAWVAEKCGAHGAIERVAVPRLECNWDPGWGFVTFASEEAAEAARASLDGTPGPVDGCNLFVEYEEIREAADGAADGAAAGGAADGAAADGAAAAPASHAEGMKVNF